MRKLASIQRIWKIEPIDGADKIELAFIMREDRGGRLYGYPGIC